MTYNNCQKFILQITRFGSRPLLGSSEMAEILALENYATKRGKAYKNT